MSQIESTYKARDVEETLDIYLYRPFGYLLALISHRIGLSPNAVTVLSMIFGVLAGHLFYYQDLAINVVGILLLVFVEALDSADGQLARIANKQSQYGRILDGLADNLKFVSIYVHLCLRVVDGTGYWWIFLVAAAAGFSHSYQSAMADFYKNAYLHFVHNPTLGDVETIARVRSQYADLQWSNHFIQKFLMRIYLNYTIQQGGLTKKFFQLFNLSREMFGDVVPASFADRYKQLNKPMIKYYNILTTNTRMIALFIFVLIDRVYLFFGFELVILNALLLAVLMQQGRINASLIEAVEKWKGTT